VLPADSSQTYHLTYNGRGITIRGDSSVATISKNTFEHINRFHVLVNATDDTSYHPAAHATATVDSNTIVGKGVYDGAQKGIWFNNGAYGTVLRNTISTIDYWNSVIESDRASGIVVRRGYLNPSKRSLILGNTVSASSFTNNKGIFAEGKKDSIADNTVTGFRYGIQIHNNDSASAVRNAVTGGQVGFMISRSVTPVGAYKITVGGSAADKNTITGQTSEAVGGFAIALSFRDAASNGEFLSTVPVTATYNDFGVYTDSAIEARIWHRPDTTAISGNLVDTVYFSPYYTGGTVRANIKVFLQGPFNTSTNLMNKSLKTGGQLADHFGGSGIPAEAVDSINIELRNASSAAGSTTRKYRPAWLLADGTICDFSDTTKGYVEFDTSAGNYFLVVRHRNHLAIMTATAQSLTSSTPPAYDFTSSQGQAWGTSPMKAVGSYYAMYGGDAGANAGVGAGDLVDVRLAMGSATYNVSDLDLNGGVGASDLVLPRSNMGQASQVP
jgi:hypothetical protein